MVKKITSVSYENWREELKERLAEVENVQIWFSLFLMGVDKQAREDGKLELDLSEETVRRAQDCDDATSVLIGQISALQHSK